MAGSVFFTAPLGPVVSAQMDFIETAGAGVYTATLVLPAGSMVQNLWVINRVLWTAGGSTATLNVRNTATANAYITATTLHAVNFLSTNVLDTWKHIGNAALSTTFESLSYPAGTTITATVTTTGAGGAVGSTSVIVIYAVPPVSVASKV